MQEHFRPKGISSDALPSGTHCRALVCHFLPGLTSLFLGLLLLSDAGGLLAGFGVAFSFALAALSAGVDSASAAAASDRAPAEAVPGAATLAVFSLT